MRVLTSKWINWRKVMMSDPSLPSGTKFIGLYLDTITSDHDTSVCVRFEEVAKDTGYSINTIKKHLRILKQAGWLDAGRLDGGMCLCQLAIRESGADYEVV